MPEYLAPGVYVEETSFRSKSIEGVGTSTTAFVGPTLKGPVGVTPELITNFGDFERIYGGFGDINGQLNYIAHAVNTFFDNGGSRLYVSRVQPSNALTGQSDDLLPDEAADVRFRARFPGEGGNGVIELYEKATQISQNTLASAPIGSILRLGGEQLARPAQVVGTQAPPFNLPAGGQLRLTIDGVDQTISFLGQAAEAVGTAPLPAPLALPADQQLVVRIGSQGINQTLNLPAGDDLNALLTAINTQLRGGYARLDANRIVLGTDVRGLGAAIQVINAPAALALPVTPVSNANATATNNVADLANVSLAELNTLLGQPPLNLNAMLVGGNLALQTRATGATRTLAIRNDPNNVFVRLGLSAVAPPAQGENGGTASFFVNKGSQGWRDINDTQVDLSQQSFTAASILTLNVISRTNDGVENLYEDLGYSPDHPRWIGAVLATTPTRRSDALSNPIALSVVSGSLNPLRLRNRLAQLATELVSRNEPIRLRGGSSGGDPSVADYRAALESLKSLEEISIVAAPGYSAYGATLYQGIEQELLKFVARRRSYQIAILDTPKQQNSQESFNDARTARSRIDSSYAALYYPWVVVANPLFRPGEASQPAEIVLPPSGFICGIYGRNDAQRGVFKTPANEVVLGALRFERDINFAEQEILNPLGINCLRFFPGRGCRVWGGRTASSDPEFKYVSVRRFFNYLEASIDRSTQWAVFEPNGERLWANIRETVTSFLYNEWVSGALLGESVQDAFFVRCDRSTMTQNDLDNGRLICLIGVAVIKPAEFVIFRIGQKTVDGRN
jgi:phage tail sheath protein FI